MYLLSYSACLFLVLCAYFFFLEKVDPFICRIYRYIDIYVFRVDICLAPKFYGLAKKNRVLECSRHSLINQIIFLLLPFF